LAGGPVPCLPAGRRHIGFQLKQNKLLKK